MSEPPRKKQKGENGDDQLGSDDMEMSDEDEYQQMSGKFSPVLSTACLRCLFYDFSENNANNAPPGFDTDHLNENNDEEDVDDDDDQNNDDLNNSQSQRQWNPNHSGNYNLIGQRLMQLAQEQMSSGAGAPPAPSNFIRPLMQMTPSRAPPPPSSFFNQNPGPGQHQGYPGPMFRPRGGRGNRGGSPFFRGGPSGPRGHNNYRGNNFRGVHRGGRW